MMLNLRSARKQAYRYGREVAQTGSRTVTVAWREFLGQFAALESAETLVSYLEAAYADGLVGDTASDRAFGYEL